MAAVLKVSCQDQLHRILLTEETLTYTAVQEAIQKLYPGQGIISKYLDEENDLCTLCQASFPDFHKLSGMVNGRKILKLFLTIEAPGPVAHATSSNVEENCIIDCATSSQQESTSQHEAGRVEKSRVVDAETESAKEVRTEPQQQQESTPQPDQVRAANPIAAAVKMGLGMFKAFAKQGFNGLPHMHHCRHGLHPKKLKFLIWQLHNNGMLDANSAAAIGIHSLPALISHVFDHSDKIDRKVRNHVHALKMFLEELRSIVAATPGVDQCAGKIADLLRNEGLSASEVFMELLTSLDTMPLEAQADFLRTVYASQESRLLERLAEADQYMAWWPEVSLEHNGVACDGCDQCPLQGLRFKCKTCPDYDLCANCFVKQGASHSDELVTHEFEMVMPCGKGSGKGKGKCWGKGVSKGKGKCKGKFDGVFENSGAGAKGCRSQTCASTGCTFAATWHPTHCCEACRKTGGKCHGLRCEKASKVSEEVEKQVQAKSDGKNASVLSAEPVHEDAGVSTEEKAQDPDADGMEKAEADFNDALKMLEEMGFGDKEVLREMLKSLGGDLQKAIEELTA